MGPERSPNRPLRLGLVNPTYWPEVRRGTERLVHDLAVEMSRRGHEVKLVTGHAGRRTSVVEDGVEIRRLRRSPVAPPMRHYEDHLSSAPQLLRAVRGMRLDIIHSFHLGWSWPLARCAPILGAPLVAGFHGVPTRQWLVARRYRLEMQRTVNAAAAATTALSQAAAERMNAYLFESPAVLPGGVFVEEFSASVARARAPTLISTSSLGDPRKRADLLFGAFKRAREVVPGARLLLVGTCDPHMSRLPVQPPAGVEWVAGDRTEEMAAALASAWASVLAADGEAFGLVLVESLAAGTPVIAADTEGPAEILTPLTGRSFEAGSVEKLSEAMIEALREPPGADRAGDCRARAREFDWGTVGDRYEDLYERVLARS